ncbi:hypothetical protein CDAR_72381 [Caerostris darwini]|uniref:Uncharacterized protein n=1 Tax=Caerostris darwini TaxID=1538125 RepID=A0AAV4MKK3_9ARAC|nr:hypothetical protein CDAR_72381 [Caerostris darwini]
MESALDFRKELSSNPSIFKRTEPKRSQLRQKPKQIFVKQRQPLAREAGGRLGRIAEVIGARQTLPCWFTWNWNLPKIKEKNRPVVTEVQ